MKASETVEVVEVGEKLYFIQFAGILRPAVGLWGGGGFGRRVVLWLRMNRDRFITRSLATGIPERKGP